MDRILVTGGLGQIGTALTLELRKRYGNDNVILSDIKDEVNNKELRAGPYEKIDVCDAIRLNEVIEKHKIDTIFHLAAILSATGEKHPFLCWDVNITGTLNILKSSMEYSVKKIFIPSSIAVWGPNVEKENTPQESVLQPTTMYGVTKVSGEVLCDYFVKKHGLDIRGIRYPGIISSESLPGGGTTDYAVDIFYKAIESGSYECFLSKNTRLPMMYMPDCVKGTIDLMEADFDKLNYHSNYNLASFSFSPEVLANEIKKIIPEFQITYKPDYRQDIADSWPSTVDDSPARKDWLWKPDYNLEDMTKDMIEKLKQKM